MNSSVTAIDTHLNNISASEKAMQSITPTMKDLLEDGIYLLFLLRGKNSPASCAEFNQRIDQYLNTFDRVCKTFNKPIEAVLDAKYAFCALLDEIVLSSGISIRDEWELAPLQLRLFGEHLAGERFFDKLEQLRQNPAANIEQLEVFHTCLLLGFQGKYLLEGKEKLNYLIAKLGQEIVSVRGPSKGFAPNWKIPLKFNEYVRHELPLWLYYALLAVIGIAFFLSLQWLLAQQVEGIPVSTTSTQSVIESTPTGT
ncbi:MAG: type IVB secretion system protein IcmH/DotU [Spongiibacteraceae bacterium]